ncbi:hypothetical protein HPB49_009938 [Dermacentor silvarum]|uniref:Uncharacterized protein n=1 Tax=Dermacentor silvarum TaxID=543639 RepID=A0ACB8DJ07_DERSI|nr:hypothetical protein HPB49_009938 [Dermacentor silvarum]
MECETTDNLPNETTEASDWLTVRWKRQKAPGLEDHYIRSRHPPTNHLIFDAHRRSQNMITRFRDLKNLHLGGQDFAATAYVAAPADSARGVARGFPASGVSASASEEDLLNYLSARGRTILHARTLVKSSSALVTFSGHTVPFYITYAGAELRCTPYHHTTKVCGICLQVGHRTDVCLTPGAQICPTCSVANALPGHACPPKEGQRRQERQSSRDTESETSDTLIASETQGASQAPSRPDPEAMAVRRLELEKVRLQLECQRIAARAVER